MLKLGDNVVVKECYFKMYEGNEFTIVDIDGKAYKLKADGFDYIWADEKSIEKNIIRGEKNEIR